MFNDLIRKLRGDGEYVGLTTFVNPYSYYRLRRHSDLIRGMDNLYIDGFLLVQLLRLGGYKTRRVSMDMTSLAPLVFEKAAQQKQPVALVGSKPGIAEAAAAKFRLKYPDLDITLTASGYFGSRGEKWSLIESIVEKQIPLVIVGMGAVRQEAFLVELRTAGWQGIGLTCGAFLEQTAAGGIGYYPNIVNRLNLRWMYRIVHNPKLMYRYFIVYPWAATLVVFDMLLNRIQGAKCPER